MTMINRAETDEKAIGKAIAMPQTAMLKIQGLTKRYGGGKAKRKGVKPSRQAQLTQGDIDPLGANSSQINRGPINRGLNNLEQNDRLALDNLNLNLLPGEIYGLLGPNGAGKTTTINLICNLLAPDSGSIEIAGQPVSEATKLLVGIVPQKNLLYGNLTCAENLNFFAQLYGVPKAERHSRVARCLAQVNLTDRAHSPAESLSGGMKRRLSIALALVHQPKLVILDEPTTGLDIEARYELWELIRQLKAQGATVMLTTHLLEEAERLCDRIGIIRQGKLLREGTLKQLRQVVQAKAIAQIESPNEAAVRQRATELGWSIRQYGSGVALWLPTAMGLRDFLAQLDGVPIAGATIHPVRLEHVYLEITRSA